VDYAVTEGPAAQSGSPVQIKQKSVPAAALAWRARLPYCYRAASWALVAPSPDYFRNGSAARSRSGDRFHAHDYWCGSRRERLAHFTCRTVY
jgi:hypothetical protein